MSTRRSLIALATTVATASIAITPASAVDITVDPNITIGEANTGSADTAVGSVTGSADLSTSLDQVSPFPALYGSSQLIFPNNGRLSIWTAMVGSGLLRVLAFLAIPAALIGGYAYAQQQGLVR